MYGVLFWKVVKSFENLIKFSKPSQKYKARIYQGKYINEVQLSFL